MTACDTGAVVISSMPTPVGAATSAKQDTGNASLATIAGAVAGAEMQVDVLTVASGDNTIGRVKLTDGSLVASIRDTGASDSLNVAIVDAAGAQITTFGGGTEYTEDVAAAADPVGGANILVRKDVPAAITSTDGDNIAQRGTNYGAAYCQILDSSGNYVNTFGGGSQYTEGDADATITGTAAMMEVAANVLQPVQGTVADGLLVNLGANNDVVLNNRNRADTYTGVANGTAVDASTGPVKHFSLQVKGTGAVPTSWQVRLEASLNNANWTQVGAHTTADGDGVTKTFGPFVAMYFRTRCEAVTLGSASNIIATVCGVQ